PGAWGSGDDDDFLRDRPGLRGDEGVVDHCPAECERLSLVIEELEDLLLWVQNLGAYLRHEASALPVTAVGERVGKLLIRSCKPISEEDRKPVVDVVRSYGEEWVAQGELVVRRGRVGRRPAVAGEEDTPMDTRS